MIMKKLLLFLLLIPASLYSNDKIRCFKDAFAISDLAALKDIREENPFWDEWKNLKIDDSTSYTEYARKTSQVKIFKLLRDWSRISTNKRVRDYLDSLKISLEKNDHELWKKLCFYRLIKTDLSKKNARGKLNYRKKMANFFKDYFDDIQADYSDISQKWPVIAVDGTTVEVVAATHPAKWLTEISRVTKTFFRDREYKKNLINNLIEEYNSAQKHDLAQTLTMLQTQYTTTEPVVYDLTASQEEEKEEVHVRKKMCIRSLLN